jgi:predicted  nucleic acid-binding Zn-ribbon protein
MNIYDIISTIHEDWTILIFVFTLGAAWWQLKHWFAKVTSGLDKALIQHDDQNKMLEHIQQKTDILEERSDKIETTVNEIHDKLHEQEVKLAVLESVADRKVRSSTK